MWATTSQAGGGAALLYVCVRPGLPFVGPGACAHSWVSHLRVSLTLCMQLCTRALGVYASLHAAACSGGWREDPEPKANQNKRR